MSPRYPQLHDEKWLREQYLMLGKSSGEIAAEVGCSPATVLLCLQKFKIKARSKWSSKWASKLCERCQEEYTPAGPSQRFCSAECRAGTKQCDQCGKEFPLTRPKKVKNAVYARRFCSLECRREWQSQNSKHRYITPEGYVIIKVPPTMSRKVNSQGYVRLNLGTRAGDGGRVLEHRWVMEQTLGRPLLPSETVHHINGDKTDNRPENLQLRAGRHGKGVRYACADCGSHNVTAVQI